MENACQSQSTSIPYVNTLILVYFTFFLKNILIECVDYSPIPEQKMSLKNLFLGVSDQSFSAQCREENRKLLTALFLILAISSMHYLTDPDAIAYHNVARRLYYLPIVISAFALGVRGGLMAALLVTLFYFPHAFLMAHHHDPAPGIDKVLEVILYYIVGVTTGVLVERERSVRLDLQSASTKRDELQGQLIQASKMTALGELSSGLAHEIRNPLASILGSAEALSSEFESTHKKRRIADLMLSEIDRLNGVVSRFLTFAKPGKPVRKNANILALLQHTIQLLPDSERCEIDDVDEKECILADQNQIQQVLLNLSLNGLAASENPKIIFQTSVHSTNGRSYQRISVKDNGSGVDKNLVQTLFDPFITSRDQGTGLGLSISSQIMDAHGGFIDYQSTNIGSIFHLNFPMEDT